MTVTVPSSATFKARHPRFESVDDDAVTLYLTEASRSVNDDWDADDAADAIMYLAAHLMVMEGALAPTKAAPGIGNQITLVKAGEVQAEFDTKGSDQFDRGELWETYKQTIYGRRFLELAARNGGQSDAAVLVV